MYIILKQVFVFLESASSVY